jgi:hypothetical protein
MLAANLNTITLAPAAVIGVLAAITIVLAAVQQVVLILHTFDRADLRSFNTH